MNKLAILRTVFSIIGFILQLSDTAFINSADGIILPILAMTCGGLATFVICTCFTISKMRISQKSIQLEKMRTPDFLALIFSAINLILLKTIILKNFYEKIRWERINYSIMEMNYDNPQYSAIIKAGDTQK